MPAGSAEDGEADQHADSVRAGGESLGEANFSPFFTGEKIRQGDEGQHQARRNTGHAHAAASVAPPLIRAGTFSP